MMKTKVCGKCGVERPLSDYYLASTGNGLRGTCKYCMREDAREHRAAKRERRAVRSVARHLAPVGSADERHQCRLCGRVLPLHEFYRRSDGRARSECSECMRRLARERWRQRSEGHRAVKNRTRAVEQRCVNCGLYPCFEGIDTMQSNLALTCRSWREKNIEL